VRTTLLLLGTQLAGSLLVFVVRSGVVVPGSEKPLLATEGEFFAGNTLLVAARRARPRRVGSAEPV
jgi:hypothetical protein